MLTRRTVRNGDVDIAVFEQGNPNGQVLLLLHGWPDTHRLWTEVSPLLADRFRLVSVDNRGHGESSDPTDPQSISVATLADDYAAVIDAVSPDHSVHIVAHDWGSIASWELITRPGAEERIASFTSVSGPSLGHTAEWARTRISNPSLRNITFPLAQLATFAYTGLFALPVLPKAFFRSIMTEKRWRKGISLTEGTHPKHIHLAPTFSHDIVSGLRIYRNTLSDNPLRMEGKRTEVPVQIIIGTRDPAIRQSGYADETRWAERVWLRVVKGGHWLPFSHPRLLATAVAELVDTVGGGQAPRTLRRARMGVTRKPFEDTIVVITGAGSGIGRETALAFARDGAEVVLSDITPETVARTAELVEAQGGIAHHYQLDISDADAVTTHAAQVISTHGVPDIVVNNAGIAQAGRFLDTPSEEFDRVLAVNLRGVINGCRAFAVAMVDRGLGGHIVNLSSMAAYTPLPGFSAYSTSKSAVFMFSDCLRAELAGAGIGVSTICPGIVHTNIVSNTRFSGLSPEKEAARQAHYDRLYRKRGYGPEKVADHILTAVRKNKQIVPVTPESVIQYRLHRLLPRLSRFLTTRAGLIR